MFTIIEDSIYKIDSDKIRKVIVVDGQMKIAKDSLKYTSSEVYTLGEIKKMYHSLFEVEDKKVVENEPAIEEPKQEEKSNENSDEKIQEPTADDKKVEDKKVVEEEDSNE